MYNSIKKMVGGVFILGFATANLSAQNCPNANFSMGDFTNWIGYTGSCCPINIPTPGINLGVQHTIMTVPGADPLTGGGLQYIPPGYLVSARLGNSGTGAQAEGLTYPMVVDNTNALFILKFAVVMQDPSHSVADQPRFEIQVKDQFNNIIPCTEYLISAAGSIPGFQNFGQVRWRDWTTLGIDLTGYIGQPVTVEVRTGDCALGGHYGYGYLIGECQPLEIAVQYCPGDTLAVLTAPGGFQNYLWSNGAITQSISVNDPDSVSYDCTITSFNGCTAVLNTVIDPIVMEAGFSWAPPCVSIMFQDTSTINYTSITQWDWDFGNGATSTQQNPIYQYPSPGTYNVQLIATSSAGCSDTTINVVVVDPDPTADFILPTICGSTVTFTDSSFVPGHTIVGWQWDFGDGGIDSVQNPTYTFANDSIWQITLIAYDERGCFDTIVIPYSNNPYPIADFNFTNLCEPGSTPFLDSSYVDVTSVNGWTWDFNGLGTSSSQNPSFTFPGDGTYNVTLISTTTGGCTDTITQQITVYPQPQPSFTASSVCEGFSTYFTNGSTIPSGSITGYNWNFGSLGVPGSTTTNPDALYPGDGTYNVTLTATSNFGCTQSVTVPIDVWPNPEIAFTGNPLEGCAPLVTTFTNGTTIPSGTVAGYSWTFGGGNTSTSTNPQNLFPITPGTYDVTLYAISDHGCDTSITLPDYITVHPDPTVNLGVDDSLCENASMILDAGSGQTTYLWNTGANTQTITLNGGSGGTYWASVINQFGCGSTDSIFIKDLLLPIFSINDLIICEGDTAFMSIPDTSTQTFSWSTAGLPGFDIDNQMFTTTAGTYWLTVTNFCGSITDSADVIYVPNLDDLVMPNVITPNNDGVNDLYAIIDLVDAIEFRLTIFDRWGVQLFETTDINTMWNGDAGNGVASTGTYFAVLSYINCYGKEAQLTSTITVFHN